MRKTRFRIAVLIGAVLFSSTASAQTSVTVDASPAGRRQVIDGFGTALNDHAREEWYQQLYLDDLKGSIARMDITPRFKSPYSDLGYFSPGFGGPLILPGPDRNNVRAYRSGADYERPFGGFQPRMAVMGPDIDRNIEFFDFTDHRPANAGALGRAALARRAALGDFKLLGTTFSPAPWLKVASGNTHTENQPNFPIPGTPYPFIWNGNFSGGYLDVSGVPLAVFHDGVGPTSALTQYARSMAAYLRGFQRFYGVNFYAVSIQNELNFEQFYDSCSYPLTSQLAAAIKALRAELDRYPDLAGIQIVGPEDLLIDSPYSLWQFGGGDAPIHKNLRYLHEMRLNDQTALANLGFFAVHGSPGEQAWDWWTRGWSATPQGTLPSTLAGFASYGKKSWMTETSGEDSLWPAPGSGTPYAGAMNLAININRALTTGAESAWLHWQFADESVTEFTLTDRKLGASGPKYVAAKHFFRPIRPNAVRLAASASAETLQVSAYVHDRDATLTVVLLNLGTTDQLVPVNVQGLPGRLVNVKTYTSGPSARWVEGTVAPERLQVQVPAYGIVTLQGQIMLSRVTLARGRLLRADPR